MELLVGDSELAFDIPLRQLMNAIDSCIPISIPYDRVLARALNVSRL